MGIRGENQKSVEARTRRKLKLESEKERITKEIEDSKWIDNDKLIKSKERRKEEKYEKLKSQQARKSERKQLEETETNEITSNTKKKNTNNAPKLTLYQISTKQLQAKIKSEKEKIEILNQKINTDHLLTPNINHIKRENTFNNLLEQTELLDASNIDDICDALVDIKNKPDIYKKAKVAYANFVESEVARYKIENPELKRSQVFDKIAKAWNKSPLNPISNK